MSVRSDCPVLAIPVESLVTEICEQAYLCGLSPSVDNVLRFDAIADRLDSIIERYRQIAGLS